MQVSTAAAEALAKVQQAKKDGKPVEQAVAEATQSVEGAVPGLSAQDKQVCIQSQTKLESRTCRATSTCSQPSQLAAACFHRQPRCLGGQLCMPIVAWYLA